MRRRDTLAAAAVLATAAVAIFALGSSTRLTALITAALALACATPYLRSRRAFQETPPLLLLIGLGATATLVQALPLPLALVGVLSPEKAALIRKNAAALGEEPGFWTTISLEPAATWLALASLVGAFAVASAAIRIAATSRGRTILAQGLVIIATSLAAVAVVHQLAGATTLFGIYEPAELEGKIRFLSPLMNPNHLAGVLAVATPIGMALAVSALGPTRLVWAGCSAVCAITALLTQSRTGAISLLIGIAAAAILIVLQRAKTRRVRRRDRANRLAAAAIAATLFVSAAAYFGQDAAVEISQTEVDELTGQKGKLAVWRSSTALLWEHKVAGVGRGAFEQGFTPRLHDSPFRYSHVENEYLQAAIDWGIPLALLMLVLLVAAVRIVAKRATRSVLEAGLFAGLIAAAVHHVSDFAIELPGPAIFVAIVFAALSRTELTQTKRKETGTRRFALLGAGAVAIAVAASPLATLPRADSKRVSAEADPKRQLELALDNWKRHPADYIAAGQVADALRLNSDGRAFKVASRALAINPTHWQLHLTVARMLLQTDDRREQALGEYRLAADHARYVGPVVTEMIRRFPEPHLAVRGMPQTARAQRVAARALRAADANAIGLAHFREMAKRLPGNATIFEELTRFAFNRREWEEAARAGRRAFELGSRASLAHGARALLRAERAADAAELIESGRKNPSAPKASTVQSAAELHLLARARVELGQLGHATDAIERALDTIGRQADGAAPLFLYLAEIQEKMGHVHQANKNREAAERLKIEP